MTSQRIAERFSGNGVTVAVISSSYNALGGEASDVATGNLPGPGNPLNYTMPVVVIKDRLVSGVSDPGRAMLQVIHALAPNAKLCFHATIVSDDYDEAVRALADPNGPCGATVIADDAILIYETPFEDGPGDKAVDEFVANGGIYFGAANNAGAKANVFDMVPVLATDPSVPEYVKNIDTTERFWYKVSAGVPEDFVVSVDLVAGTNTLTFYWNEFTGRVWHDINVYLINSTNAIIGSGTRNSIINGLVQERFQYTIAAAGTYKVAFASKVILPPSVPVVPQLKGWLACNQQTIANGTIRGHAGSDLVVSSAAYRWSQLIDPTVTPRVQNFSSYGPVTRFWNSDGSLFSLDGIVREKPDFGGADCLPNTAFQSGGRYQGYFELCGTTGAAAALAGATALLKELFPPLTRNQLKQLVKLTGTNNGIWKRESGYGLMRTDLIMDVIELNPGTFGDPHLVTFDGSIITYYSDGDYTLAEAPSMGLSLQARFCGRRGDLASYTCSTALRCTRDTAVIEVHSGATAESEPDVLVGGRPVTVAESESTTVFIGGDHYATIQRNTRDRITLSCDGKAFSEVVNIRRQGHENMQFVEMALKVDRGLYSKKLAGLLGTLDFDPSNDVIGSAGAVLTDSSTYRNVFDDPALVEAESHWRVHPTANLFSRPESAVRPARRLLGIATTHPWKDSPLAKETALRICKEKGLDGPYAYTCAFDILSTGSEASALFSLDRQRQ
eukprot:CAMPEP_0184654904 /NCGR_PEP_ID=MMETSP0308-20130426/12556_1 /TAXON_ID=38269 /ORGANISM="Gloeochaete witrockiana, Strain SAG 46.84" /LENGTH=727 /DNA_ID=CAMNT_0027091101 /DNA_START=453 /DNA_END=2636 /DNA_ORIENTATION=+